MKGYQKRGVRTTLGKNLNPIYVNGEHEPIIDHDTWHKVQKRMEQNAGKSLKVCTGHFPLTGLLRCPMCSHAMISHKVRKSKSDTYYIRYYQCSNFHAKGSAICKSNLNQR
ncbi:recombinase zinc beta ribbon domain-containing protein [Brevibacillus laterosporus]|uniref:recombinase zinc beta ribbon domain-containing protein n=1 Tax=Brevibacillus laterosporus TaxID=1465 RepID=UPI003D1A9482